MGRRGDGYHELDSLVVFLGLADRLSFAPSGELSLEVEGPFAAAVPAGDDNLVLRAARLLAEACGVAPTARIALQKNLPVAAGIGGGSADAAAALDGLSALWGARIGAAETLEIARRLGADVPVCLYGRPAFIGGAGEAIERAPPLPSAWFVLANPAVALSTREVFQAYDGSFSGPARWHDVERNAADLATRLESARNDLEPPARRLAPQVEALLDLLGATAGCLLARMSGSGATCFGIYGAREEALAAVQQLQAVRQDWWAAAAPLLHGKLDLDYWGGELSRPSSSVG